MSRMAFAKAFTSAALPLDKIEKCMHMLYTKIWFCGLRSTVTF